MQLHGYFRSSAAYRVRIALSLKGLAYDSLPVHLTRGGGEQHSPAYLAINPERLVPTLQDGDVRLTQSLSILEYLEERYPATPLLPTGAAERGWVRAIAAQIACDVHPLNNLRVLQYLERTLGASAEQKSAWIAHWITEAFDALEVRLARDARSGLCCFGNAPTFADCCLVPQVFSARRFSVPMDAYPNIVRIDAHLSTLESFQQAAPSVQADADQP
ncbi:maleylacetoacetate isomerase [Variovorax beijingensis]|uniref:Maleylacetoacetate isomerase n=1 Tax=Variovorax beijingensis TaxID=2496117 RepID=A0A3P3EV77_9BURK|nr:maleylacetoacetate isomerase [Variovorax beijingensis]RRH90319.1 maleylacetoacetate isomerase [Variovorax beijingensis]